MVSNLQTEPEPLVTFDPYGSTFDFNRILIVSWNGGGGGCDSLCKKIWLNDYLSLLFFSYYGMQSTPCCCCCYKKKKIIRKEKPLLLGMIDCNLKEDQNRKNLDTFWKNRGFFQLSCKDMLRMWGEGRERRQFREQQDSLTMTNSSFSVCGWIQTARRNEVKMSLLIFHSTGRSVMRVEALRRPS